MYLLSLFCLVGDCWARQVCLSHHMAPAAAATLRQFNYPELSAQTNTVYLVSPATSELPSLCSAAKVFCSAGHLNGVRHSCIESSKPAAVQHSPTFIYHAVPVTSLCFVAESVRTSVGDV